MIHIKRPNRPNIYVYKRKSRSLDKDTKEKLKSLLDNTIPEYADILDRIENDKKFTSCELETLKSITFFADKKNFKNDKKITSKKTIKFSVYKNDALKAELKKVFHGKCAYCDSDFMFSSAADIEHYRPKAAINTFEKEEDKDLIYPGYYWLGADWDNLLWSCQLCNRKSKLEVPDKVDPQAVGKKNRFPIKKTTKRIRSHNENLNEEESLRLLVDPCRDDPAKHFTYPFEEEEFGIIRPKVKRRKPDPMAKASIPAYALNRVDLVRLRKMGGLDLQALFRGLIRALDDFIKASQDNTSGINKQLAEQDFLYFKKRIKEHLSPQAPYLGFKRLLCKEIEQWPRFQELSLNMNELLPELVD